MNQKQLNEIKLRWKGKGGGPESETTVCDSKMDKDCVSVWSCNSDIALKILVLKKVKRAPLWL